MSNYKLYKGDCLELMKHKTCTCCFNPAVYESQNSDLCLCEYCYITVSDEYEDSYEDGYDMSFDEFYELEEIEED